MKVLQNKFAILLLVIFFAGAAVSAPILAFPGAEGYGKYTVGGRGGKVFEVTNLNDSGEGSLRAAVEAEGPRTVVFKVSGTIDLKSNLTIRNPYITIAGQTAPGDGICIKRYPLSIGADEVIVRYIRVRLGDESGVDADAVSSRYNKNLIIDHVSASWSVDETMSIYHNENVTVQWCLISESLYQSNHIKGHHGFGGIWGSNYSTYHHNLLAHHSSRNPRFASGCGNTDYRNNVLYNWGYQSCYGGEKQQRGNPKFDFTRINMVANYYKPGPATRPGECSHRIAEPSAREGDDGFGQWYIADNVVEGNATVSANNWDGGVQPADSVGKFKMDEPWPSMPINQQTAEEAYLSVLENAGATYPKRDAVDARIIEEVRSGFATYEGPNYKQNSTMQDKSKKNGIIDSQNDVGGWPELKSSPAPPDSDHDGMPDAWEKDRGFNPNDASDGAKDRDGDGYTNVEEYINELVTSGVSQATAQQSTRPDLAFEEFVYKTTSFRSSTKKVGESRISTRLRVVVSTDFPPIGVVKGGNVPNTQKSDPDDMQSMVRFLLYANEFDIEGLIASAGTFANIAKKQNVLDVIDRYEMVYDNLKKHDPLYPTPDYLRSVTFEGRSGTWGKKGTVNIGEGKDSEASDALIAIVDKPDPRPIYIGIWGDCSVVAQAVWKVQKTRSAAELETFLSKLRIHQIATQDGTIGWLRDNFPKLSIIHSHRTYQGMFGGSDLISNLDWVNENVRDNHGPLCAVYPHEGMGCTGVCEGDSPSFLWLVSANRGVNDPDDPTQPSWGGQFKKDGDKNHYIDGPGPSSISKWRPDYQSEFQERADWCVEAIPAKLKPRVVVLTDISTWETDDHESLIRFLAHADMFEIEGLVISTGYSIKTLTKSPEKDFINIAHGVIDAYEKDLPNLMKRSNQVGHAFDDTRQEIGYWPSPKYLRERTMFGSLNRGKKFIGDDNDSPGSDLIIKLADEDDPRPVWVTVWGGGNTVAQSIYRVKKDRTAEQFKTFLRKIRIYTITDQDRHYTGEGLDVSAHGWIREQTGSDLLFIWDECAWKAHNGTGRSNWNQYETHIQGHGNLGSQYPKYKYGVEGDTPSFLYLMPTGLNNPEDPTQCSWGGTFNGDAENLWRESGSCRSYFDRFYPAAFNNFAARMDWAKSGAGNRNPVIVLDGDDGISILTKTPRQGTTVTLDASQTSDPDGDNLTFKWWIQSDAGSYSGNVNISNSRSSIAKVNVPSDSAGKSFHVICEVIDDGPHNLSDYRRIVFKPIGKD